MFDSCLQKQNEVKKFFASCKTSEAKYEKIIEIGKSCAKLDHSFKTEENKVPGCQSIMYLHSRFEEGKVFFQTESDALISQGLGMLLTKVYSGESPETILKYPPSYIEELQIVQSLTPSRANGLASIYIQMKQRALMCLIPQP